MSDCGTPHWNEPLIVGLFTALLRQFAPVGASSDWKLILYTKGHRCRKADVTLYLRR